MTMIEERIKACVERHPDWGAARISNSIAGSKIPQVRAIMGGPPSAPETPAPPPPPAKPAAPSGFVTLDKIRDRYDIKAAILRELARIPRGKLIGENDLAAKAAGNDRNRFRRTVENNADTFEPHRIKLRLDDSADGKYFWGGREDIATAKSMRDL
jgi:hypothetical protein